MFLKALSARLWNVGCLMMQVAVALVCTLVWQTHTTWLHISGDQSAICWLPSQLAVLQTRGFWGELAKCAAVAQMPPKGVSRCCFSCERACENASRDTSSDPEYL
jgi:hypothetical protein